MEKIVCKSWIRDFLGVQSIDFNQNWRKPALKITFFILILQFIFHFCNLTVSDHPFLAVFDHLPFVYRCLLTLFTRYFKFLKKKFKTLLLVIFCFTTFVSVPWSFLLSLLFIVIVIVHAYSKSLNSEKLPWPLPNFGIVFQGLCDI